MATAAEQRASVDAHTRAARAFNASFGTIHAQQDALRRDRGASGPIWVSRFSIPAPPEEDLRQHFLRAVKDASDGTEKLESPAYAPSLHAEWTGRRAGADPKAPEPQLAEPLKYERLQAEARSAPVVLYVQGGGYVFGSTVTARAAVKRLCNLTGAPVLSLNYRLAPRDALPAALLDVLVAYVSLLSPPAGALHGAVKAEEVVLAGESAGAALCLGVVQVLLNLRRRGVERVRVNGREVEMRMPAGLALVSPPGDILQSLPSVKSVKNDWLWSLPPWSLPDWPEEPCWPSTPPRGPIYCDWSAAVHPFLAVTAAADWRGAPPIWVTMGNGEAIQDSVKTLVRTAAEQGVVVKLDVYEYMTHAFVTTMPRLPQAERAMREWAGACSELVERRGRWKSCVTMVELGELRTRDWGHPRDMQALTREEALVIMRGHVKANEHVVYLGQRRQRAGMASI